MPKSIQTGNRAFHNKTDTSAERIKSTFVHCFKIFQLGKSRFFGRSADCQPLYDFFITRSTSASCSCVFTPMASVISNRQAARTGFPDRFRISAQSVR